MGCNHLTPSGKWEGPYTSAPSCFSDGMSPDRGGPFQSRRAGPTSPEAHWGRPGPWELGRRAQQTEGELGGAQSRAGRGSLCNELAGDRPTYNVIGPSERGLLQSRSTTYSNDAVGQRLVTAQRELDEIGALLACISDQHIREQLQVVVSYELAKLRDRPQQVRNGQGRDSWELLRNLEQDTARLARETLAFVGGASVRSAQLDARLCTLADVLVRTAAIVLRLAPTLTIPAPSEYLDLMSDVIRIRFPGGSIWDLPVTLHEFGHFAVSRIGAGRQAGLLIQPIIDADSDMPYRRNFAQELFADTFATYVAGPAYALTCLRLRFAPAYAHQDQKPTHPAVSTRAEAIFTVLYHLLAMTSTRYREDLELITSDIRSSWEGLLESCSELTHPPEENREYAIALTRKFVQVLDTEVPVVRYNQTNRAYILSAALPDSSTTPVTLREGDSIVTLLNAAWIARRRIEQADKSPELTANRTTAIESVETNTIRLMERVVARD